MRGKKTTSTEKLRKISGKFQDDLVLNYKTLKIYCKYCCCGIATISEQACRKHISSKKHEQNKYISKLENQVTSSKIEYWGKGFGMAGIP